MERGRWIQWLFHGGGGRVLPLWWVHASTHRCPPSSVLQVLYHKGDWLTPCWIFTGHPNMLLLWVEQWLSILGDLEEHPRQVRSKLVSSSWLVSNRGPGLHEVMLWVEKKWQEKLWQCSHPLRELRNELVNLKPDTCSQVRKLRAILSSLLFTPLSSGKHWPFLLCSYYLTVSSQFSLTSLKHSALCYFGCFKNSFF